ncbi:MAG: sensor histidine kinase [Desulfuromonadales bacterium]|nr:sensor histidine kinase [Desulfuromonadales bacterium]
MRLYPILPNRKLFTSNILICSAIALFMFFLIQTSLLHSAVLILLNVLLTVHFVLLSNKAYLIVTPISLAIDIGVLLVCAWFWTYQKTVQRRLGCLAMLGAVLIPVTYYLFMRQGVLIISLMIVIGVSIGIAADAALERFSTRYRKKIVAEKHDAEYNILRHLNHNVKPNILMAKSPLNAVISFLESRDLHHETLSRRLDGSSETVGEALRNAVISLEHINSILDSTRQLVTREIRHEDFQEVELRALFVQEIIPLFASKLPVVLLCNNPVKIRLHRQSFIEALHNLIRNAEVHGFQGDCILARLTFEIRERRRSVVIDYTNNGRSFPENLSEKDFLTFGLKSADSPGEGLGGAWIGKVIAAHNGSFEIVRDEHPLHFRIVLPKRGI